MNVSEVTKGVYLLSVNVEDILFEELWEIPNGVSLNSYIVKGEKTAIIDGVCGWDGTPEMLFELLDKMQVKAEDIDYLVVNHAEPDHSGWIEDFKKITSDFEIICSKRGANLISAFYGYKDNVRAVSTGETLDLGDGKTLEFLEIPNVHWPDTMITFDRETGTAFTCDAFGSFGRAGDRNFDDMLSEEEILFFEKEAERYYANIVATFSMPVIMAIEKSANLPIKIVAPGHGIVWRKDAQRIIDDYRRYAGYQKGPAKEEITLIYGSMYGMTKKAVDEAIKVLENSEIAFNVFQVPETSIGTILASAWTSTGIIIASPAYESKMFPPMASTVDELGRKKVLNRKVVMFGSYGWSKGALKELKEINDRMRMNWDIIDSIEFNGSPDDNAMENVKSAVSTLINSVREAVK